MQLTGTSFAAIGVPEATARKTCGVERGQKSQSEKKIMEIIFVTFTFPNTTDLAKVAGAEQLEYVDVPRQQATMVNNESGQAAFVNFRCLHLPQGRRNHAAGLFQNPLAARLLDVICQ